MAGLRERTPRQFSDDERWYRFFTKWSLLALVAGAGIDWLVTRLFMRFGAGGTGFCIGTAAALCVFASVTVKWPTEDTERGGGTPLGVMLLKVACHRRNRRVYARMDREDDGEDV